MPLSMVQRGLRCPILHQKTKLPGPPKEKINQAMYPDIQNVEQ